MRRFGVIAACVVLSATAAAPLGAGSFGATGTLELEGALRTTSVPGPCPPDTPRSAECYTRVGNGVVRGLGRVTEAYTFVADLAHPSCSAGSVKVLGYTVRWTVSGKGEIVFAVAESPECLTPAIGFVAEQSFTIAGGSGVYAAASGSGRIQRAGSRTSQGTVVVDTWIGTLVVPGLEFDVTPPTLSGARSKTVRAPRNARSARVTFAVAAQDAVDGPVPVTCRPRSGSRFKLGRTIVRCSATDTSGNTATASFRITVRRSR